MPVGVTTKKKINAITIGETIFANNNPNLNQTLFKGDKSLESKIPNIKKIKEIINDQCFISLLCNKGYKATIKKNIKKTIPKLLLELIFILSI